MTWGLIETGLRQGLFLSLVAFGIMISFRLLRCADLSSEGAYPLGGSVAASMILAGYSWASALIAALIFGGLIGVGTAVLYQRFRLNSLLSGIILSTMIYSVNLRLMGKPNVALLDNLFADASLWMIGGIVLLMMLPFAYFLMTEYGLRLRAVGYNPECARGQGISVATYTFWGLFLANAYAGFAGGLIVQAQQYMDISMGIGIVIHGLAALMLGESLLGNSTLKHQLSAPIVGALIYQQIQGLALSLGCAPSDLKFLTGVIIILLISFSHKKRHRIDLI